MVSGKYSATEFGLIANRAALMVSGEMDLRSMKRKSALSPSLFDDVYQYLCPSDIKGDAIIDIAPQIDRYSMMYWRLTSPEEFDRYKEDKRVDRYGDPIVTKRSQYLGDNLVAVMDGELVRKLLISMPVDDKKVVISPLDSVGTWVLFGDGTNLTKDSSNYVKGSASINWDISAAGGTTAGIQNTSVATFDITNYVSEGEITVWAYITSATNLTNFILRVGSDTSNYYSITITTNSEGVSFYAGWNLLRFSFSNKVATGTVDEDACDYVALYMTKAGAKISETDYRFDDLVMRVGVHHDLYYYTRYPWQSNAAVYLEKATADTDYLNAFGPEFNLFALKTAELIERHLGNHDEALVHGKDYDKAKAHYLRDNPSERLTYIQKYWDTNNGTFY